jgi:hypothetical protein
MNFEVDRSEPQTTRCESVPQLGDLGSRHDYSNEDWIPVSELWVERKRFGWDGAPVATDASARSSEGFGLHLTISGVSIPGHDRFPMH